MPSPASAARREAKRLASLTFFLDHQIGRYIVAKMLRAARARVGVEVHLDHFPATRSITNGFQKSDLYPFVTRGGRVTVIMAECAAHAAFHIR